MRVNSSAWLYSDHELRAIRESIHFAPIGWRYKKMIRNMIKLLALHDVYAETEEGKHYGEHINTVRKTKAARERADRTIPTPRPCSRLEPESSIEVLYDMDQEASEVEQSVDQRIWEEIRNACSSR